MESGAETESSSQQDRAERGQPNQQDQRDQRDDESITGEEPQETNASRLKRHPILDRLELNDYDFNGQSLDYEPNLEFDDTDLREKIEEEIQEMNANLFLMNLTQNQQQTAQSSQNSRDNLVYSSTSHSSDATSSQADEDETNSNHLEPDLGDENALIQHLQSAAYLESPHDLLAENFEEAFKSSLFELENQIELERQAEKSKKNQTAPGKKRGLRHGNKLNAFLRSATSGFYGLNSGKQYSTSATVPDGIFGDSTFIDGEEFRLDDNFENDDFSDIAKHNCVEVAGDDHFGRRIITIYACRLPSDTKIHHLRLLKYIMFTLNQFVENDYCVVYFHHGLNSRNKPKLSFLYQAYRAFDRRYKKNLKNLFLVHPTNFIRIVWQLFKPIISIKFGRKMRYVNYLNELEQYMHLEQLLIPKQVLE